MLFNWSWLRKIVRRYTKPIPQNSAEVWKKRLSLLYMLTAWNAFGVVAYLIATGRGDWAKEHNLVEETAETPAQQWTKILNIKDATVYRISGFKVNKYEIHNDFSEDTKAE